MTSEFLYYIATPMRSDLVLAVLIFFAQGRVDILDHFPSIKNRSYPEAAQGTATVYKNWDTETPTLSTIEIGETALFGMSEDALYKTTDGGQNWVLLGISPEEFLGGPSDILYARTQKGVYKTRNRGLSWAAAIPPGGFRYRSVFAVDGKRVYAGGEPSLFVSQDEGITWAKINDLNAVDEIVASGNLIVIYRRGSSGLFSSTTEELQESVDGGHSWKKLDLLNVPRGGLTKLCVARGALFAMSGPRVVKEESGTWTPVGPPDKPIRSLIASAGELYGAGEEEVFHSKDGARTWTTVPLPSATNRTERVESISVDHPNLLITTRTLDYKERHMYYSHDEGQGWNALPSAPETIVGTPAICNGVVFVGTESGGYGLRLSGRTSWQRLPGLLPPLSYTSAGLGVLGDDLFIIRGPRELFKSPDEGKTWERVQVPLPAIDFLEVAREGLFAFRGARMVVSRDKGKTWAELPSPGPGELKSVSTFFGKLYAAVNLQEQQNLSWQLLESTDGGISWHQRAKTTGFRIEGFVVGVDGSVYGLTRSSILRYIDGDNWENISRGPITDAYMRAFHVNERGVLFVGTDRGLFWSDDRGLNWHRATGELGEYGSADSIIPYSAEGFLLLSSGRPYVCADKTPTPAPIETKKIEERTTPPPQRAVQGLTLPFTSESSVRVLLDGQEVPDEALVQGRAGVLIRGDSNALQTLKEGVAVAEVRGSEKGQDLKGKYYVWKERTEARLYAPYGRSYAVLIAVSDYSGTGYRNLPSAVQQTNEVGAVLNAQGFDVKRIYDKDATTESIEKYLFEELNPRLSRSDRVLIYFAGHGDTRTDFVGREVGYLVTSGVRESSLETKALPMGRIESQYARLLRAKHVLFVLDACFSGLALTRDPPKDFATLVEIKQLTQDNARAILAAGRRGDRALDLNGGIFTHAFINGIKGSADHRGNGVITIEELFDEIRRVVAADAARRGYDQLPQYESMREYGAGGFIFIYK